MIPRMMLLLLVTLGQTVLVTNDSYYLHTPNKESRGLVVSSSLESNGDIIDDTAPYPVGARLNLTCQNYGRKPFFYQNVTRLSEGTRLFSENYFKVDYIIESLSFAVHEGMTLCCREDGTTRKRCAKLRVQPVPRISVSLIDNGTEVPLKDNSSHTISSPLVRLHCQVELATPALQLCLIVGQDQICQGSTDIYYETVVEVGQTKAIQCANSFFNPDSVNNLVASAQESFKSLLSDTSARLSLTRKVAGQTLVRTLGEVESATGQDTSVINKPSTAPHYNAMGINSFANNNQSIENSTELLTSEIKACISEELFIGIVVLLSLMIILVIAIAGILLCYMRRTSLNDLTYSIVSS